MSCVVCGCRMFTVDNDFGVINYNGACLVVRILVNDNE